MTEIGPNLGRALEAFAFAIILTGYFLWMGGMTRLLLYLLLAAIIGVAAQITWEAGGLLAVMGELGV